MSDTLIISGRTYSNVTGFKATNSNDNILTYIRPQGSTTISANGTNIDVSQYATINVNVPVGDTINNQNKSVTPTKSQQSITADSGYTGLGTVTVGAIPNTYIVPTGTLSIDDDGTYDVANYASAEVAIDYTAKAVPVTIYNNSTLPILAVLYSTFVNDILSDGYISNSTTVGIQSNSSISRYIPYGCNFVIRLPASAATNVDLQINDAIKIPIIEGKKDSSGQYYRLYNLPKNVFNTSGTSMYIIDSTDPLKNNVTLDTLSATSNTTYTAPAGTAYSSVTVNVPTGSTINNQNKTVTPTKSQQSITFDVDSNNYTGLGIVTVNAIPATYITTSDADAVATDILLNKTAYVNGSKITGSMANNGTTGGTITTQGGTYTIPAGYTSGGIVTANIAAGTITNTALNVASFEETTGDYGVRASITIPAGYYNQTTLTKDLSTVLPAPDTAIAENQMLAGYQAYNNEGELLTGTMTNNAAWSRTLDQTTTSVTIPAGYHNGTGTVSHTTVNIPDPTISVSSGGLITASGSWTRGFTTDNSYSNTKQLTTQAAKTVAPTESEQTAVAAGVYTTGIVKVGAISSTYVGSGITTRDSDDLTVSGGTVTAPAGYYSAAATKSVASMTLPTSTSTSATSGATKKATIDRNTAVRYINIPVGYNDTPAYYQISAVANGSVTAPSSISGTTATVSTGTNTLTLTKSVSVTPNVTTAGYISSGTAGNSSVSLTANITTKAAATITPSTSNQTIASGTYLTGTQTIAGDADLIAANIASGVTIFGVEGTFTDDASATAADIISGETAYVGGREVTGTLVVNKYYTGANAPASSLGNNGDIYFQN